VIVTVTMSYDVTVTLTLTLSSKNRKMKNKNKNKNKLSLLLSSLTTFASGFNALSFPFSFFLSIQLISFSLIFFLKFSTKFIIFSKFSNPSQISSSAIYPFHLTKYFGFPSHLFYSMFSQLHTLSLLLSLLKKVEFSSISLPTLDIMLFHLC